MREIIARVVAVLTLGVVVALSLLFASAHNANDQNGPVMPSAPSTPNADRAPRSVSDPIVQENPVQARAADAASKERIARGLAVYQAQNCATCHSIAGEGNPRYPLDGVGANLKITELEEWVTGTGVAGDTLPAAIARRKQRYRAIKRDDMDALLAYLSSLTPPK